MSEELTREEVREFLKQILRQSGLPDEELYPIEIEKSEEEEIY